MQTFAVSVFVSDLSLVLVIVLLFVFVLICKQLKHKTPLAYFCILMFFRHIIDLVDFFEGVSESVIVMEFAEGMISTSTISALKSLKFNLGLGSNLCHRN